MIGFSINGVQLVLQKDTEADLQLISAALADDLEDDFSLPFTVPRAGNERVLGFVHEFALHKRMVEVQGAVLLYQGIQRKSGVLYVERTSGTRIELTFTVEGFVGSIRDKRLPQMDLGPAISTLDILQYAKDVNTQTWPNVPCCFPMYYAPSFYGKENPDWNPDVKKEWDNDPADDFEVNDLVTDTFGSPVQYTFTYQRKPGTGSTLAPALVPSIWRRTAFGLVNHWDWDNEVFHHNTTTNNFYTLSPCLYLKYVLRSAFNALGLELAGDFMDDPRWHRLILYNNHTLDKSEQSSSFLAHQVGTTTISGNVASDLRIPAQDESTSPNNDASSVWDNVGMRWRCPSAGTFKFRVYVPYVFQGELDNLQVSMVREGTPDVVLFTVIHPQLAEIWTGYGGLSYFTLEATAGDVGQWFYFCAKRPWGQEIQLQDCWIEGWKVESSVVNSFSNTIIPNEHVPDMELGELLLDLKTTYGLRFTVDAAAGKARLDYAQSVMNRTPVEMTRNVRSEIVIDLAQRRSGKTWSWDEGDNDLPDLEKLVLQGEYPSYADVPAPNGPGCWCLVLADRKVLISNYDVQNGYTWRMSGHLYRTRTVGDPVAATTTTPTLSPFKSAVVGVELQTFLVPYVPDKCSSNYFVAEKGTASRLIGFFHGMQPNEEGVLYPYASAYRYKMDGSTIASPELDWSSVQGPIALHQLALQQALIDADPITCDMEVTPSFIDSRQYEQPLIIHGQRCLVEKMPVKLGNGRGPLIARTVTLFKLRNE